MNVAEVIVYDANGVNVSKGRTVTKSSGYNGDMFPGANLVDGNIGNFAHTGCNDVPWMQIDLGQQTNISKVVIYNRTDCCQIRLSGTVVMIIDQNGNTVNHASNPLTNELVQTV